MDLSFKSATQEDRFLQRNGLFVIMKSSSAGNVVLLCTSSKL